MQTKLEIETKLSGLISEKNCPCASLVKAIRYALLNGGKRLRPLLLMTTAQVMGGSSRASLTSACAVEMIHAYSLVHDDMPCMDNDDYRRGRLTLHKAFDESTALLVGDYLLTHAFEIIASDQELSANQKIAVISLLARKAGGEGMISGQFLDIQSEGQQISYEELQLIHQYKTGALITAAIEIGGIIAGVSPQQQEILSFFGSEIGLAYQIIDDVLDVTASKQKHGTEYSTDEKNQKSTYVKFLGIDRAKQTAHDLFEKAISRLGDLTRDTSLLQQVGRSLIFREL